MESPESARLRRWRLRLQFRLRTLLAVLLVLAIMLAWIGNWWARVLHQRRVVADIKAHGGLVTYTKGGSKQFPGAELLFRLVGEDAFAHVEAVGFAVRDPNNGLNRLPELPRLKRVELMGDGITDRGMARVARVPNLESVKLLCPQVTAEGLAQLAQAPKLKELRIWRTNRSNAMLLRIGELQSLRKLTLIDGHLSAEEAASLARLRLLEFCIEAHPFTDGPSCDDRAFDHIGRLTSLTLLRIERVPVTGARAGHLRNLKNLRTLYLSNADDDSLVHIAALPALTKLTLSGDFTDAGVKQLARLKSLTALELSGEISGAGLAHLARLANLTELRLSGEITDAGVAHLRYAPKLQTLYLHGPITGACLKELAHSKTLTFVDVGWVELTDKELHGLRIDLWPP